MLTSPIKMGGKTVRSKCGKNPLLVMETNLLSMEGVIKRMHQASMRTIQTGAQR